MSVNRAIFDCFADEEDAIREDTRTMLILH